MVRTYRRKTTPIDKEQLKKAVLAVKKHKIQIRVAAKVFGVPKSTLSDWLKKNDEVAHLDDVVVRHHGALSVSNIN